MPHDDRRVRGRSGTSTSGRTSTSASSRPGDTTSASRAGSATASTSPTTGRPTEAHPDRPGARVPPRDAGEPAAELQPRPAVGGRRPPLPGATSRSSSHLPPQRPDVRAGHPAVHRTSRATRTCITFPSTPAARGGCSRSTCSRTSSTRRRCCSPATPTTATATCSGVDLQQTNRTFFVKLGVRVGVLSRGYGSKGLRGSDDGDLPLRRGVIIPV